MSSQNDIAIVGMAAHLPGAASIESYWRNLRDGVESIRRLSEEELVAAGETPDRFRNRAYVPAAAPLDGFQTFDGEFFGFGPKESAILDPQHRQFLEVAWEALENAGHPPETFRGQIGVYAGCGMGSYFYFNICTNPELVESTGMFLLRHTGNDKDFLATRVSHVLDLKGPSINIQTACSTSLVAVHFAAQALLSGECDMALAGGVTIELPHGRGYLFKEGEILSPDGHCHAFDHRAQGTVFGSGAGVVALRRLEDALADGDHIWAVIKGTAVNNDGADKAGYLAPSVAGQARAIAEAHAIAGVTADTVGYVECHGTGTYLGDPIEVAALTSAFRETTDASGFCRIGSVKTNIGHTDTAAGVASLIKVALSLHHRQIPPSLGYESPNPSIDFEESPFRVNDRLADWVADGPRRAGVNSLGVGGTNAHAVVEEAPVAAASEASDWPFQIITLSARSRAALDGNARALAAHLRENPDLDLADVAYTLREGRRGFDKRRVLVASSVAEAADLLESNEPRRVFNHSRVGDDPEVAFMFPGGGAQYVGMARDLYETEPVFAEWIDRGLDLLQPKLDYDLRALWLPEAGAEAEATDRLKRPSVQLPLIMIVEYALAQLWMSWGVRPTALVGHSMGENTAACLAGVMSFEDCIGLVHLRGRLFDTVPAGGMLSVPMAAEDLAPLLGPDLDIASVNAPELSVASGPQAALDALAARLAERGVESQRIPIDIAAHSRMLEPILDHFGAYLRAIRLSPPEIPILSNRSGTWLTDAEATDPAYWVAHLRGTVRFADCVSTLAAADPDRIYLEMGPGKALSSLAQAHGAVPSNQVLSALRHPDEKLADDAYFLQLLGRLWAVGVAADWEPIWAGARRRRLPLPTYAFQRAPYFIAPGTTQAAAVPTRPLRRDDVSDWGWGPVWRPRLADCAIDVATDLASTAAETWLVFTDEAGVGAALTARLREAGHRVVEVRPGDAFGRTGEDTYVLAPERGRDGYDALVRDLVGRGTIPTRIVHLWLVTEREAFRPGSSFFHRNQEQGFYALLFLAQAIADEALPTPLEMTVVTSGAAQVRREPLPYPEKATVAGPARVIPRELPGVTVRLLDIVLPEAAAGRFRRAVRPLGPLTDRLLEEIFSTPGNGSAALRGDKRFALGFEPRPLPPAETPALREGGVALITGGFGGIGLSVAESLARTSRARLVLVGRSALPPRPTWETWLRRHGPGDATVRRIRAVQRLEELGAEVMVAAADVCNVEDMRAAVALADERFGVIDAVIHAAGVIDDGPLLAKTQGAVEDVLSPKIHGTKVIDAIFPDGSLDWLVLFSSTSTVTAPAGQVDYVAANEFLNAYAHSRAGGRTRVLAIDWGIWAEVGMAATALAERTGDLPKPPVEPAVPPLLDTASFDADGHRIFDASYAADTHWAIDEHRTAAGEALLPGTGYLELAAEALSAHGETGPFEIRDLYFLRPLAVADQTRRPVRVRLARSDEGYRFEVRSGVRVDGREGYALNAQATLAIPTSPAPAPLDLAAIATRCTRHTLADGRGTLASPQEAHLRFGPRWRVLKGIAYGAGEGLAMLRLPDRHAGDLAAGYLLHPALLDLATGWAMELIEGYEPTHLWVPVSYRSVRVHAPLPAEIRSWVRIGADNRADGPIATFDVTLSDPSGAVLVEVEGFSIRRLDGAGFGPMRAPSPAEVEFADARAGAQPLSPTEERLAYNLTQGIRPDEGADAFARALATGAPQVVVSSLDLDALSAQAADSSATAPKSGQSFDRPDLDTAYVEPRNDVERMLAGFWEDLLGVGKVGVDDSFFDLGGHSLIAVRLFVMIKKAYRVEFPISVLFEAPTIAKCAALIADRLGIDPDSGAPAADEASPKPAARRYKHLVAMHQGEGGQKTPFFLVAGMFGNVLNLRHLAHLIGADRPFYGLQARGLYGDEEPHRTFDEAAADYIAELRTVQPHGPYLLGGFSGGGITAYEMARQLEAAGEQVALVVLLDTPVPMRPRLTRRDRLLIRWAEFRADPGFLVHWARDRIAYEIAKRRKRQGGDAAAPAHAFHDAAIEAAFLGALPLYRLQAWEGTLALFRPALDRKWKVSRGMWVDSEREYVFDDNDWTRWAPQTRVFEVPGDHDSMVLEPNVRVLAARMKACIEAAERGRPPLPLATAAE